MAIAESQLATWSHQGSITQSASTYAIVRRALEDRTAPYANWIYSIFLQGSYANHTNIFADSDVDIVMQLDSVYYSDTSELPEADIAAYQRNFTAASYSWQEFRTEVTAQLVRHYGAAVTSGRKAITIAASANRREADVIPVAKYRRYFGYKSALDQSYAAGICFWLPDGTEIVNYPKQHAANCTAKHQASGARFKPHVRMFKNMRNAMINRGYLADGIAPSYFIEGMLYNVPNSLFEASFGTSFLNVVTWLRLCDRDTLVCANELYRLLHPTSPVTWRDAHLTTFLEALLAFWEDGG